MVGGREVRTLTRRQPTDRQRIIVTIIVIILILSLVLLLLSTMMIIIIIILGIMFISVAIRVHVRGVGPHPALHAVQSLEAPFGARGAWKCCSNEYSIV